MPTQRLAMAGNAMSIHMSRYLRHRTGMAISEIAKADKVTETTIDNSIRSVTQLRALHTNEFANESAAEVIVENKAMAKSALAENLRATVEMVDHQTGKTVMVPDLDKRLKGVAEWRQLITAIQKREGMRVNVKQQNATIVPGAAASSYVGMEDMVRKIHSTMQERQALPDVATIVAPPEEGEEEYSRD